jgi:hypothetical protein
LPAAIDKPEALMVLLNLIGIDDFNVAPFLPTEIRPIDGVKLGEGKNLASLVPLAPRSRLNLVFWAVAVRAAIGNAVELQRTIGRFAFKRQTRTIRWQKAFGNRLSLPRLCLHTEHKMHLP